jgi:DNA-binding transcriptional LysR family regulator
MLDIKKLRYFVAVAEEGHFGRAATRLGISQPPLSDHIQQLEGLLQTTLLHRTTRRVSLTSEGIALLQHARKILSDMDQCAQVVQQSHSQQKQILRLGILHAHTYTFLPHLLRHYLQAYPAMRIELVEYTTREQVDTLVGDQVDVGLIREPVNHPALKTVTLFTEHYALAAPAEWRLARTSAIPVSVVHDKTLIGYPSHDDKRSTRSLFRDYLQRHQIKPADFIEVRTMHAALALVAAGLGCAPVPESQTSMQFPGLKYHRFQETPPRLSVGLAWREDHASALVANFKKAALAFFTLA